MQGTCRSDGESEKNGGKKKIITQRRAKCYEFLVNVVGERGWGGETLSPANEHITIKS